MASTVLGASILTTSTCSKSATAPTPPPFPLVASFSSGQIAQGQTATFTITWDAELPGDTLSVALTGVANGSGLIVLPRTAFAAQGSIAIPAGCPDGKVVLHASILSSHDTASATLVVLDTIAPGIDNSYAWVLPSPPLAPIPMVLYGEYNWNSFGNVTFVAGITDSAQMGVSDNHGLAWAGWALSAPASLRDSVRLNSLDTVVSIPLAIPASLAGTIDSVSFFARDVDGNLTVYPVAPGAVAQYADHPVVQYPHATPVPDLAFDPKHGVVLIADPTNKQVQVFKIPSLALQTTITLPHAPAELDVTPGGDSALVLLDSTATVAVINLASGYSVSTFSLPSSIDSVYPTDTVNIGWRIRIAADDRALITMRSPDAGVESLVEVNLVNDSIRIVIPALSSGGASDATVRSPDGSLIVLPGMPITSYNLPTRYIASTHTYAYSQVPYGNFPPLYSTLSNSPYDFLSADVLLDATGSLLGSVGLVNWFSGAISANARDVYMPASPCTNPFSSCLDSAAALVVHYRVPDFQLSINRTVGQPVDIFDAPQIPNALALSPDGNTLIAVGPTSLMAFDLTQSSPSAARARLARVLAALRGQPRSVHRPRHAAPATPPDTSTARALTIHMTPLRHR